MVFNFDNIEIDKSFDFDIPLKERIYLTHGYYTYPAKFIPQLASRLICEYSKEGDFILDCFSGSGTTVLEALVNNRIGIGVDISEIAELVGKVKTTPIDSLLLAKELGKIELDLFYSFDNLETAEIKIPDNKRLDFWFLSEQKKKLGVILARLLKIENEDVRYFYFLAFAQILRTCSFQKQRSNKPSRDMDKIIRCPLQTFLRHARKMVRQHKEFNKVIKEDVKNDIDRYRNIICGDIREQIFREDTIDLIVTSPPYSTSYEYADLHELPLLWFEIIEELRPYRQYFIGSSFRERDKIDLKSDLAYDIIERLEDKKKKEIENYYADMLEVFIEMKRILKRDGKVCIVIGNSVSKGVELKNAEVFAEQLSNIGFEIKKVIKRNILNKTNPIAKGEKGYYLKKEDMDNAIFDSYAYEFILIAEKT